VLASKSNTFISGLVAVVSTCCASAPLVVAPYIAAAGTHIVSKPAILTAAVALLSTPVPLGFKFISTLVSPVAERIGPLPVEALASVNSLTAEPVAVTLSNSFPLVSKIFVIILGLVVVGVFITGLVKVLFVKVCVPVRVTSFASPTVASKTPVFVATPSR
jgi:hypothetical protein